MQSILIFTLLLVSINNSIQSTYAQEIDPSTYKLTPVGEVGGGFEGALHKGGVNFLLRVRFGIKDLKTKKILGLGPEESIWVHARSDFGIGPIVGGAKTELPYWEFAFSLIDKNISVVTDSGGGGYGGASLINLGISRDIRLNQNYALTISVLKAQVGFIKNKTKNLALIAQLTADALGYKTLNYTSNLAESQSNFYGIHTVKAELEGGLALALSETSLLRILVGGSGDLNVVPKSSLPTQSDLIA